MLSVTLGSVVPSLVMTLGAATCTALASPEAGRLWPVVTM